MPEPGVSSTPRARIVELSVDPPIRSSTITAIGPLLFGTLATFSTFGFGLSVLVRVEVNNFACYFFGWSIGVWVYFNHFAFDGYEANF